MKPDDVRQMIEAALRELRTRLFAIQFYFTFAFFVLVCVLLLVAKPDWAGEIVRGFSNFLARVDECKRGCPN
jgi:hypothetical protein